jgi:hypothetical protein
MLVGIEHATWDCANALLVKEMHRDLMRGIDSLLVNLLLKLCGIKLQIQKPA